VKKDVQQWWRTVKSGERFSPLRHDHAKKEKSISKTLNITKENKNEKN